MTFEELYENFSFLDDWESKYSYLIDLGNNLPSFAEIDKNDENKIDGCMSQVWLKMEIIDDIINFHGESDAHIVRGLIAVLQIMLSGKTKKEILEADIPDLFKKLGLDAHLSPSRRNGFFSMVERIKKEAKK
ncbi:MAG: SufE family protein [Alphaproteobacteria bacterium]|nr:SufE family protein [Alphaproteobacteria bacterium]